MLNLPITAAGISLWGILFLAIIAIGVIVNFVSAKKELKAAICQIQIIDGDKEGNLLRIENAIAEARAQNAELVCFPQSSIFGWLNPEAHNKAAPIPGPDTDFLCGLAKKYKVYLCLGIEEKDGENLFNSALLIDDNGQILLKHRQINIARDLMNPPYTPGDEVAVIPTKFGKIGLLVDSDTQRDDILGYIKTLKPDLILAPMGFVNNYQNRPVHFNPDACQSSEKTIINAAQRTETAIIGTNPVGQVTNGPLAGSIYCGKSIAIDKKGTIIAVAKNHERDVKIFPLKV